MQYKMIQSVPDQPVQVFLQIFRTSPPAGAAETFDHAIPVAKLLRGRRNLARKEMTRRKSLERVDAWQSQMLKDLVTRADHRNLKQRMLLAFYVRGEAFPMLAAPLVNR